MLVGDPTILYPKELPADRFERSRGRRERLKRLPQIA